MKKRRLPADERLAIIAFMHFRATASAGVIAAIGLAAVVGCSGRTESNRAPEAAGSAESISADAAFRRMLDREELIESLTPGVLRLARGCENLKLPDHTARRLFSDAAQVVDVAGSPSSEHRQSVGGVEVVTRVWPAAAESVPLTQLAGGLWRPIWDGMAALRYSKLGILRGQEREDGGFSMELSYSGAGDGTDGRAVSIKGTATITWAKDADEWRLVEWRTTGVKVSESSGPWFEESLRAALPDDTDFADARRSVHEDYIREVLLKGGTTFRYKKEYWPYLISWDSLDQHPSVQVVDIDQDGWDDLYVTARWGRNQLWRNRGDGTFENIAARVGLDLDGLCNAALFGDFDNDGDPDVFIGRSLERGLYFRNEGGTFIESTDTHLDGPLPYWTSSMAAADYNGDGQLDLYVSTYRLPITKPANALANEFLDEAERAEWKRRRAEDHPVFRLTGPPNVLLVNRGGGRFERAPEGAAIEVWLSSFQSTWADYDNDRDPDLFVANDYGPDFIFRNDSDERGGRRFTDVTKSMAGDELNGFGMGVSLGDYDNDGRQDPFFTYMFSKAGSRITEMFQGLEARMYEGVRGNKLLRNVGDRFELVSGDAPPALPVAKTGWSWGGQFADIDNDGWLDLYVANGYYTPPEAVATEVDL
ncbi:MAG: FG-GAP repeat domain-containing protein [Verrucomicrobiales bacterium]